MPAARKGSEPKAAAPLKPEELIVQMEENFKEFQVTNIAINLS